MRSVVGYSFVVLGLAVAFAPAAQAQDQPRRGGADRPALADQLKEALGLTDEQVTKVKAIDEQMRADMSKARDESGGDRAAMREKMTKLQETMRASVKELLTKEQLPKFDEWVKKEDERRAQGRQRGGNGGGGNPQDQAPIDSHPDKSINVGTGGFDYLFADAASRKLYVAHATKVVVIDMDKDETIGEIEGVDGAHGTAIAAAAKHGFATAGKKQKLIAFDTDTNKVLKEIDTGAGPDAVIYASSVDEAWSINHKGGTVTCVNAKTFEVTSTIEVGGTLEFAAEIGDKVYVNIENKNQVAVIDAKKHSVITKYDLGGGEEPTGIAADPKTGLLFVGCGGNKKLVILEAATGKIISTQEIGGHCDAVAFDAETNKVYASCGDGATSVIKIKDATTFESLKAIPTARGAKTCAIDTKTHKLYTAVGPRRGEQGEGKVLVFATGEKAPAKTD